MIKNYFLLFLLITSFHVFSQEIYLNTGKNFTNYVYKNSFGQSDLNLQSGSGNFYEIGLTTPLKNKNILYSYGLSLNEYNAIGGDTANSYRWDTKYMGITGGLSYSFLPMNNGINFLLNLGLNGGTIIYGNEEINGTYYDLVKQKEFSGLMLGSTVGLGVKYPIPSFGYLSIGYSLNQSINLSNTSKEKLSFLTNQIQLGFHFPIN